MRLRRSRTLIFTLSGSGVVIHNFMTRQSAWCDAVCFDLLSRASDWTAPEQLLAPHAALNLPAAASMLQYLLQGNFLVAQGTPAAKIDLDYEKFWKWEVTAGLYHFGMKDPPYMTPEQAMAWMEHRGQTAAPVSLYSTNDDCSNDLKLPPPDLEHGILSVMHDRRSIRSFVRKPISLEALRDCLFAGFGITGFLDAQVEGSRALPVKMSPSGGARNPYEGYVYVNRVSDLAAGLYHYSGYENSIGLITSEPSASLNELLVGQHWAEDAAVVILLVANFERTMWKYPNATAYRVVLIEAGHIAQNVALAAVSHHLATTPTAALNDTCAHRLLALDWVKQALVYAILLGEPVADSFESRVFTPHSSPVEPQ